MSSSRENTSWRSATAVRTGLIAAAAAAVAVGSYQFFADIDVGSSSQASETTSETTTVEEVAPFTTADAGTCLDWQVTDQGELTNFERTSCEEPHRFEVSDREDLATYPSSEFGPDAESPDITRQAQLREELCSDPTLRYLDGRFDPLGRYSIASILPPPQQWEQGDRTMLCGVQSTDREGNLVRTTGYVANQDQGRVAEPGECLIRDESNSLLLTDCAEDHHFEVTSTEDMAPVFPNATPTIDEQDAYLEDVCTQAAIDYLGSEEALYQSTLQPYWISLPQASWVGGSNSTNCSLVHANEETGFSTLRGSATAGTGGFTINGQPPAEQPERNPVQDPAAAQ